MNDEEKALALRFGTALKRLRLEKNLTQSDLAEAAGLSTNHLSYLECGERLPSLPMLLRLSQVLRTSVGALLGEVRPNANDRLGALLDELSPKALATAVDVLELMARGDLAGEADKPPVRLKQRVRRPLRGK